MTGQEGCTNTIGPAPYEREENIWAAERFLQKLVQFLAYQNSKPLEMLHTTFQYRILNNNTSTIKKGEQETSNSNFLTMTSKQMTRIDNFTNSYKATFS